MMRRIFKYQLEEVSIEPQRVMLPEHSVVIHVDCQNNKPCLWVMLDDACALEPRYFNTFETGENIGELWTREYVGTALLEGGKLVCHVFEVTQPKGLVPR